mmetsp:Transcript_19433/g.47784  ORF Transcript_19433/g.47784 Transcript_19433/m.47784 type:complete len:526 (+) Transcript_19433:521-2098(+)
MQNLEGLLHGRLRFLRIRDGLGVARVLLLAHRCGLGHRLPELLDLVPEFLVVLLQLGDGSRKLLDVGCQLLHLRRPLVTSDLVVVQLLVAPLVVLGLLTSLSLKPIDEIGNHLLDLSHRVPTSGGLGGHLRGQQRKSLGLQVVCLLLHELEELALLDGLSVGGPQLEQRGALHQAWQMLLGLAGDGITAQDVDGLADGCNLLLAGLLPHLKLISLLLALSVQIRQGLHVVGVGCRSLAELLLGLGGGLVGRSAGGGLVLPLSLVVLDLVGEVHHLKLIGVGPVGFLLVKIRLLIGDLLLHLLEHVDDGGQVGSVRRGLGRTLRGLGHLAQHPAQVAPFRRQHPAVLSSLLQEHISLADVVVALLELVDTGLQSVQRLAVVSVLGLVISLLLDSQLRGGLHVGLSLGDLAIQSFDLLTEALGIRLLLADLGLQLVHCLLGIFDGKLLLLGGVAAEAGVLLECLDAGLLLLLGFGLHALQQLHDLFGGSHSGPKHNNRQCEDKLHGCRGRSLPHNPACAAEASATKS